MLGALAIVVLVLQGMSFRPILATPEPSAFGGWWCGPGPELVASRTRMGSGSYPCGEERLKGFWTNVHPNVPFDPGADFSWPGILSVPS